MKCLIDLRLRVVCTQESVLSLLLFIIFIIDIDHLADDTKMLGKVLSEEDIYNLISDLKGVHSWPLAWKMLFNAEKGRVIHFGHGNKNFI